MFFSFQLQKNEKVCKEVGVSTVDNFQGEENDIILLTLVRSNEKAKVGFLRTDNRVCVALSRARHGFYIIGNMEQLCLSSDLWKNIKHQLMEQNSIGDSLALKCENHPKNISFNSKADDIYENSPLGGCKLPCSCSRKCHIVDMKCLNHVRKNFAT